MNWYRQIKLAQDYITDRNMGYQDIGHKTYRSEDTDCSEYLWIWMENRIHVIEAMPDQAHDQIWGRDVMTNEVSWKGRAEQCTWHTRVSITGSKFQTSIPSVVTRSLYSKFGQDAEVYLTP